MNDTTRFLIKVIALSAVLSLLIKVAGSQFSVKNVQALDLDSLNRIALTIILLPSLIVGSFLAIQR